MSSWCEILMFGPVPPPVSWLLTAAFVALAVPPVRALGRRGPGQPARDGEAAELLFAVAMAAMVSPLGGPIPAAGWQALLLLALGWFVITWWRGRPTSPRHAVSAAAMLLMVSATPHGSTAHGPWLTMSTMAGPVAGWWSVAVACAACWFLVDAAHSGITWVRGVRGSRTVCRVGMSLGMAYLFVAAI